jgi:hypothetical protein
LGVRLLIFILYTPVPPVPIVVELDVVPYLLYQIPLDLMEDAFVENISELTVADVDVTF